MGIFSIMKFTKFTFLMLGVAAMVFLVSVNAKAACTASAGQFCKASSKHDCRPNCYCTGGSNTNTGMDIGEACSNRWGVHINELVGTGIHLCPSGFPNSDEGASSAQACYTYWIVENELRKVYNQKINCPAGMFIQSGFPWCMGCKDNENVKSTEYCPGVEDFPSQTENYRKGVFACTGKVSDDKKTCMEISKNCPARSYMPANSQQCTPCPNGYVCLGGNYEVDYPTDQGKLLPKDACTSTHGFDDTNYVANGYGDGCDKCATGTQANTSHTECVAAPIKISAGYYLPANSVQQQKCSNPKKFCPGGEFWKSSVDQGQYDCPFTGTSASSNYQRCTVTLSSEQLKFGALGDNGSQCWSKTDPEDFQYCVLGLRGIKTVNIKGLRDTIQENIRNNGLQTAVFIGNQQANQ